MKNPPPVADGVDGLGGGVGALPFKLVRGDRFSCCGGAGENELLLIGVGSALSNVGLLPDSNPLSLSFVELIKVLDL